jgi:TolA-binding protein
MWWFAIILLAALPAHADIVKVDAPKPAAFDAASAALVLLGDCQLAEGKADEAVDNYLTVVTHYDLDSDRAAEAKYKAAKAFEQPGNWKRARDNYDELLKESPSFAQAGDAEQGLAELIRAHPE